MKKTKLLVITSALLIAGLAGCSSHQHEYIYVKEVPSTCMAEGTKEHYTCEDCNKLFDAEYKVVKASDLVIEKAHKTTFKEGSEPTCTENGYYAHYECVHCHTLFTDEEANHSTTLDALTIVAAGTHDLVHYEAKANNCLDNGHKEYYQCDDCDKYFLDVDAKNETSWSELVLEATGHDIEPVPGFEMTCDSYGVMPHFYCNNCELHYEDEKGKFVMEEDSWIIEASHDLVYREQQEATYYEDGIALDHYHCKRCKKNYTNESATEVITDDIVTYAYSKSFSFENNEVHPYVIAEKDVNLSVTTSQYSKGTRSLKVELTSNTGKIAFNKVWLEKMFALSDVDAIFFDVKGEENIKDFYYDSFSDRWGVKRYEPIETDQGIRTYWKTVTFTKAMYQDLDLDNVVIRVDNAIGKTIYVDNIRVGKINGETSFEHHTVASTTDNNYLIKNNTQVNERTDLLVNSSAIALDLTDKYSSNGSASLHIKSTAKTILNVYVPYDVYQKAQGSGIYYDMFIPSADVMHVYPNDDIMPRPYINDNNFGKWTTFYIAYDKMQVVNNTWARIFGNRIDNNFEFYIDNIRIAKNSTIDFETQNISSDVYDANIGLDKRNTNIITDEISYTGAYSLKIIPAEGYVRGFTISNSTYNNLSSTGGIRFYMYANAQLNLTVSGDVHYYNPVGEWKEIFVPKSLISKTDADHYVILICEVVTIYIDNISIY